MTSYSWFASFKDNLNIYIFFYKAIKKFQKAIKKFQKAIKKFLKVIEFDMFIQQQRMNQ
jgi:hypothetical protein